ncbi:MAG: RNA methyltransferase [Clostridia bacterium]|nr:RNA methyltransferase [Clostridia bacterium]
MNPIKITSAANPLIKELKGLQDKKGRQKEKAVLLEGIRLVSDALESGALVRYFVIAEGFIDRAQIIIDRYEGTKIFMLPDGLFERVGETQTPQGIMAVVDIPHHSLSEVLAKGRRLMLLESLQDPGNLGTIIRTADACGFDAVLLSKDSVDPFNPKVVRSTMGSLFHLPIIVLDDLYSTIVELKAHGIRLVCAHPRDGLSCWEAHLSDSIAIVIGNEGNGLTEQIIGLADVTVMIPMEGKAESLNASVAASMLLYESMRQKTVKKV